MAKNISACNWSHMRFLKKIREDKGLSQYAMAKLLGMLTNTYVHYETKAQGLKLEALVDIKNKLNLSWNQLGGLIEKEVDSIKRDKKLD